MPQPIESKEDKTYASPAWLKSPLGRYVLAEECALLDTVLPRVFGYFFVQLGHWGPFKATLRSSSIRYHYLVNNRYVQGAEIVSDTRAFAFSSSSLGAVLLAHALEYAADPRQTLREVHRALVAGGHVIIFGFNPWSVWGLARWLNTRHVIAGARVISVRRMSDWLKPLGFEIVAVRRYLFRPPLGGSLVERLVFLDSLSRLNMPPLAGAYMLVAKKRVACLTPPRLVENRRKVGLGALEPTT